MIPLSLSSTLSFTTGPIFGAILAFLLIREKLNLMEMASISLGILGTTILIMPQWFLFLNLDAEEISKRLHQDEIKNGYYYIGIILALMSSAMDVISYYIVRKLGMKIPSSIVPFTSGYVASIFIFLYCLINQPFDTGYFFRDFSQWKSLNEN
jgi:drug/metabolite transporter (DMT)-like permease